MIRRYPFIVALALLGAMTASPVAAQTQTTRRAATPRSVEIGGYAMVGQFNFAASESFDAVLGTTSGGIFGGGATVGLPFGGLFVDVGAWRYSGSGERAFVADGEVFPVGIPLDVEMVPIEISAGWKFRIRSLPKLLPYVAGGYTSLGYKETSPFAGAGEDVDERFGGYHLRGGAEFKLTTWLGVAGEAAWTSVPDALGKGGVSAAFNEDNLGGTSFRARITVGR
jgi:hypothetical protein